MDDEVETNDKGVKYIDVSVGDINKGESNKARSEGEAIGIGYESLSENRFDKEESEDFNNNSR